MIYSKKANFPYPILMNNSDDYKNAEFEFDVSLQENTDSYIFKIDCHISSKFLLKLIRAKSARLLLIIKSKDNQYHIIQQDTNIEVKVLKSKLSLNNRTVLQLMIQATDNINFENNYDLNYFYDEYKDKIIVHKGMALGFSNLVTFDGSQKKPYDIFEKKVDNTIKSDIEIRLSDETIIIVYKKDTMQFQDLPQSRNLNNPYIYLGLQKALFRFLANYAKNIEEGIKLEEISELNNALDQKLYRLMISKSIDEVTLDNIDEIIYLISDNILKKYVDTIRGIYNGN